MRLTGALLGVFLIVVVFAGPLVAVVDASDVMEITGETAQSDEPGRAGEDPWYLRYITDNSGMQADGVTHAVMDSGNSWLTWGMPSYVTFDLGQVYNIASMRIWNNHRSPERAVKTALIQYSEDGAAWTDLGTYNWSQPSSSQPFQYDAEVDFGSVRGRYVKWTNMDNFGGVDGQPDSLGLAEVIFYASTTPLIEFASAQSSNLEAVSPAVIGVTLSRAETEICTVDYAVTGGTATSGSDYLLSDGTLTFNPGETGREITLEIVQDGLDEEDETLILEISNPTGPNVQLGAVTSHTYTILDPRPAVGFDLAESTAREDSGSTTITVSITDVPAAGVTVDYSIVGGTATSGLDYLLDPGTLSFDAGQTSSAIEVEIVADALAEGNETVILALTNPSGVKLGISRHVLTITEFRPMLKGAFYFRADTDPAARVGEHCDVKIRLGDGQNELVFRRDKGYLPVWYGQDAGGQQDLPVEVARGGCETTVNWYSRVEIIETSPARAVVHWRYATNCSRTSMDIQDWVDEYFTVYPDGTCIRSIANAAGTSYDQWMSMAPVVRNMQLLNEGIFDLPASWLNAAGLVLNSGDYANEGFDPQRRCYTLRSNVAAAPTALTCTLDTSGGKTINNPAIVIKNWGDSKALVTVNGSRPELYYTGYAADMYGDDLVVWLDVESAASIDVAITPQGPGSQIVGRARPPVHSYNFDDSPPLPLGSPEGGPFGAYYTRLPFNDRFDREFRHGPHADVVVQFDDNAHRFVFWRGTNYQPHLAGDYSQTPENPHLDQGVGIPGIPYSCWYGTQFVERRGSEWGIERYLEPMSDQQCRYSHVRIISSNAARAIVQWRYAPCHLTYECNNNSEDPWGDWVNEYYVIYPDAISVRNVDAWSRKTGDSNQENPHIEYHEMMPITNPGTVPEDNIHWHALSATDYNGNKKDWEARDADGGAMTSLDQIANKPIMVVRMKGSTVPITVYEGTSTQHDPIGQHDCRPFNHYDDWPAWPAGDRGMGGSLWNEDPSTHCYRYFWRKYPAHCSTLHVKWKDYQHIQNKKRTKVMLFGMYDALSVDQKQGGSVNELIPLARSWEYAPSVTISSAGFSGGSYDKVQRAYEIARDSQGAGTLEFKINASGTSPVYNPCFVIRGWEREVGIKVNGQDVAPGADFRQGIEFDPEQTPSLVVWLRYEATLPVDVRITSTAGPDIDGDGNVDELDLRMLANNWLIKEPAPCIALEGDANGDCVVDFEDFAVLAVRWLAGP